MTLRDAIEYEIAASPIADHVSWEWLQNIIATYYAWKARRKYQRYLYVQKRAEMVKELKAEMARAKT